MSKEVANGFKLKGLKFLNDGGLTVKYSTIQVDGSVTNTDDIERKSPRTPHPDLPNEVDKLKKHLALVHNMMPQRALKGMNKTEKLKTSVENLQSIFNDLENETLKHIDVTGFSLSGDEENPAIIITGVNRHNGEAIALNSCRIHLTGTKWGWEHEVEEIVLAITSEVEAYLFKGKAAQLDLFEKDEEAA
jgi:hypothetical protein